MSGDEHPSLTNRHWRDAAPPLFTKEQLESSSGTATSLDMATLLAVFTFVGVVVHCPHTFVHPTRSACMHALRPSRHVSGFLRGASAVEPAPNLLCRTERRTRAARHRGPAACMAACRCRAYKASGPQANSKGRLTLWRTTIWLVGITRLFGPCGLKSTPHKGILKGDSAPLVTWLSPSLSPWLE